MAEVNLEAYVALLNKIDYLLGVISQKAVVAANKLSGLSAQGASLESIQGVRQTYTGILGVGSELERRKASLYGMAQVFQDPHRIPTEADFLRFNKALNTAELAVSTFAGKLDLILSDLGLLGHYKGLPPQVSGPEAPVAPAPRYARSDYRRGESTIEQVLARKAKAESLYQSVQTMLLEATSRSDSARAYALINRSKFLSDEIARLAILSNQPPTGGFFARPPTAPPSPTVGEDKEARATELFNTSSRYAALREAMAARNVTLSDILNVGRAGKPFENFAQFTFKAGTGQKIRMFVDELGNVADSVAALRQARQRLNLQQTLGADRYARANQEAQALGLGPQYVKKLETQGSLVYDPILKTYVPSREQITYRKSGYGKQPDVVRRVMVSSTGETTPEISSRFRSPVQNIEHSVSKMAQWSFAVGLIYGGIGALNTALVTLIDNESKLADATVVVNSDMVSSADVFDRMTAAAKASGAALPGVIEAYKQAYRATGSKYAPGERAEYASALLGSALSLSKLSGLSQTESIDILSASLYQTGDALDEGSKLLDKWVAVSRSANVEIATLASSVALLGDAAELAGVNVDELNGLMATLAQSGYGGNRELANTLKTLLANYATDTATSALQKYGIATKTVTGDTRDFIDVLQDLYSLRKLGQVTETEFQALARAVAGGPRQAKGLAQLTSTEGFSAYLEAYNTSLTASGDSTEALARKLDTAQTSITNLGTSFQELAMTLGSEGGILNSFSDLANFLTTVIEKINGLMTLAGRAGPALLAVAGASLALRGKPAGTGRLWATDFIGSAAAWLRYGANNTPLPGSPTYYSPEGTPFQVGRKDAFANRVGGFVSNPYVLSSGLLTLQLLSGASEFLKQRRAGDIQGSIDTATQTAASIGGGILGVLISGGNPVGAAIGSAAANAFIGGVTESAEISDLFAPTSKSDTGVVGNRIVSEEDKFLDELFKNQEIIQNSTINRYLANIMAGLLNTFTGTTYTGASLALEGATPEQKTKAREFYYGQNQQEVGTTYLSNAAQKILDSSGGLINDIINQQIEYLREQLATGDIKTTQYTNLTEALVKGADVNVAAQYAGYGQALIDVSDNIDNAAEAYQGFVDLFTYGSEEVVGYLTTVNTRIAAIKAELEDTEFLTPEKKRELEDELALLTGIAANLANTAIIEAKRTKISGQIPPIVGSMTSPISKTDFDKVIARAIEIDKLNYGENYEVMRAGFEEFRVLVTEAGEEFYQATHAASQEAYQAAMQQLKDLGEISLGGANVGFTQMDITYEQLVDLVARSQALTEKISQPLGVNGGLGYTPDISDVIIATSDEQLSRQHVDMKIMQYLLQEILDTEKKQLDGMYNIPDGATFWVPITAAYYRNKGTSTGSLQEYLNTPTPEVIAPQQDEEKFVRAVKYNYADWENLPERPQRVPASPWIERIQGMTNFVERPAQGPKEALPMGGAGFDFGVWLAKQINSLLSGGLSSASNQLTKGMAAIGGGAKEAAPMPVSTKLDLRLNSTVNLLVDGRTLATVIKPYLAQDLATAESAVGTITKNYVI